MRGIAQFLQGGGSVVVVVVAVDGDGSRQADGVGAGFEGLRDCCGGGDDAAFAGGDAVGGFG